VKAGAGARLTKSPLPSVTARAQFRDCLFGISFYFFCKPFPIGRSYLPSYNPPRSPEKSLMNIEETKKLAALIAGVEAAIAHLVNILHAKGVLDKTEVAASYVSTAALVSPQTENRAIVMRVLQQVAQAIETAKPVDVPPPSQRN
jgi:hypothetical protein